MKGGIIHTILLFGLFLALFLIALLVRKKNKAIHDLFLGAWLLFLGLYVGLYAIIPRDFFNHFPWMINLYVSLLFLNGPMLLWYVKSLVQIGFKISLKMVWHFLPVLTFNLCCLIFFSNDDIRHIVHSFDAVANLKIPVIYLLSLILIAISVPAYITLTIGMLRKHRLAITDNFSALEGRKLTWLLNVAGFLGIAWLLLLSIFMTHHVFLLFSDDFCINGLFLTLAVFIIAVGYFGLNQPAIFTSQNEVFEKDDPDNFPRYAKSTLKEEELKHYLDILDDYMVKSKPYLDNQLSLSQLANDSKIPLHYLSRIINEFHHQNFFDFINSFRVEEFKRRITDPRFENFTLLAIAFDCGFNSKSSFNRFFRKVTGITPSEYKNTL